jgi:hypothetical protein
MRVLLGVDLGCHIGGHAAIDVALAGVGIARVL